MKIKPIQLVIMCCSLGLTGFVIAGAFEQGMTLFEQRNYVQAEKLWQPLAKKGDVRAQFNLALALQKQTENRKHYDQAAKYLAMSRAGGLIDAYFLILSQPLSSKPAHKANNQSTVSSERSTELKSEPIEKTRVDINPLQWLNQQKKKHYTLQLATGKSKKHLLKMKKKLLANHSLEQPHNLTIQAVESQVAEKRSIRFLLLYGVFESYQQSKEKADKLSILLKKSSPWIRQFGVLQSIVNTENEKSVAQESSVQIDTSQKDNAAIKKQP